MKSTDLMREEIKAQSKLFTGYAPALYEKAVTLLKEELNSPVERIYITGCGDSFFAGMEFQDLFYEWTGVEAFAVHALEFSRYVCPKHVSGKTLVLSISASGKVTRTIEAAARAKEAGGHSIAITSNAETPLAKAAGRSLEVTIPNNISLAPGVRSYAASQVSLICLALGLSKVKGTLDDGINQNMELCDRFSGESGRSDRKNRGNRLRIRRSLCKPVFRAEIRGKRADLPRFGLRKQPWNR